MSDIEVTIRIAEAETRITKAIIAGENRILQAIAAGSREQQATPLEDTERRLRDLEVKALHAEVREESPAVVELKSRIRNLEARVTLIEKGPAAERLPRV